MKRKATSGLLVLMTILSTVGTITVPSLAAETDTTQEVNAEGSQSTTVTYEQASSFTVSIPKSIALSSDKSAAYSVSVKGDIAANETVTVTPDATVTLSDHNGKSNVTGQITQEKTLFDYDEIIGSDGDVTNGTITAVDLTAGDWIGTFNFVIGIDGRIGNDIALTSSNLATYNIETTGDIAIPEYVSDEYNVQHKVTIIGNHTFKNCTFLTGIDIPETVTKIGTDAFANCKNLTKVSIPVSIQTLGSNVFDGCTSLSAVIYDSTEYDTNELIPAMEQNGVTVNTDLFEHAYGIPEYNWSDDYLTCTAKRACTECPEIQIETANTTRNITTTPTCTTKGTTTYTAIFKNSVFTTQVKNVQDIAALGHSYATEYTIDTVATCTTAGSKSQHCARSGCTAKQNVTSIAATGHNPIDGICTICNEKIAGLYDASGNFLCSWEDSGIDVEKDYTVEAGSIYPTANTAGYFILTNKYPTATKAVIPDSVTRIGKCAFMSCYQLTSITFPSTLTEISDHAFQLCTRLTSVTLPNNVSKIGRSAFYMCSGLTNITFSPNLNTIGACAFSYCNALTSVTFKNLTSNYWVVTNTPKSYSISHDFLSNTSTAATYLTNTYVLYTWTK